MDKTLAKIKYQIEQRYKRINTAKRRPSTEYVQPEDIRELFLPFVADPTTFQAWNDEELQDFYTKWYDTMYREKRADTEKERKEGEEEPVIDDSFDLLQHLNITLPHPEIPDISIEQPYFFHGKSVQDQNKK